MDRFRQLRLPRQLRPPLIVLGLLAAAALMIACASPAAQPDAAPAATDVPAATVAVNQPAAAAPEATDTATATSPPATPAGGDTGANDAGPTAEPPATPEPPATLEPPATPAPEPAAETAGWVFTLEEGTVARFKVEEVLARTGFKIATGVTSDVAGNIEFDPDGGVVTSGSRIVVQAGTLRTDSNRRDGYVRNRTLETDTYPEVVFVPTAIDGLPADLGDVGGSHEFTITGDLTIKDQTREVSWEAQADFGADGANPAGMASVTFTFDDFGMTKPSVAVVLSVDDEILLELDFVGTLAAQ
jgi:polyisoprenoid-binding protein YceI